MKVIDNDDIKRIQGYLDALDDINGGQREFYSTIDLISSEDDTTVSNIKFLSESLKQASIVKVAKYPKSFGIGYFLEQILLLKPFSGLYPPFDTSKVPEDILQTYKEYVIFHLEDYIDFALIKVFDMPVLGARNTEVALIQNEEVNLISIVIKKDNIRIIFRFYRKNYTKEEYLKWFDQIIEYHDKRVKEQKL